MNQNLNLVVGNEFCHLNPFMSATEPKKELNAPARVRRRLRDNNVNACSTRKVPFLSSKHIAKRLSFAKAHANWPKQMRRNVLWTDEFKAGLLLADIIVIQAPVHSKNSQTCWLYYYGMGLFFIS